MVDVLAHPDQNLAANGESENVVALLSPAITAAAWKRMDDPARKSTLFSWFHSVSGVSSREKFYIGVFELKLEITGAAGTVNPATVPEYSSSI